VPFFLTVPKIVIFKARGLLNKNCNASKALPPILGIKSTDLMTLLLAYIASHMPQSRVVHTSFFELLSFKQIVPKASYQSI